jgi:SAM-dependent methyltransferase
VSLAGERLINPRLGKIRFMPRAPEERSGFDRYASGYHTCLNQALAATGEDTEYFARGRVRWLARCLSKLNLSPASVLDFGCGTGTTAPLLLAKLRCKSVLGVDSSSESIAQANQALSSPAIRFLPLRDFHSRDAFDCVYCNGVFHHIPLSERLDTVNLIRSALRPGGIFAFWENNPWNPGTRYVMSQCAFDEDAITVSPTGAHRMLRRAGFERLRTDYLFYFPNALARLRPLESILRKIPLGGQYQILCRRTEV